MKFQLMGMAALSRRTRFIAAAWSPTFLLRSHHHMRSSSSSSSSLIAAANRTLMLGGHRAAMVRSVNSKPPPKKASSSSSSSSSSPWLMLPPTLDESGKNMVYQFYSLADDKVVSLDKKKKKKKKKRVGEEDIECAIVGSSHGWLALLDRENCDLFLSNPISGRRIKLPPIINQLPHIPLDDLRWWVNKVIISTSDPENDQDCRAMVSYGPTNELAFCCPAAATSSSWSLLPAAGPFAAHSSKPNLFLTCGPDDIIQAWDLRDPLSPSMTPCCIAKKKKKKKKKLVSKAAELQFKGYLCPKDFRFLVVKEDQIFHVKQYVLDRVGPDGSYVDNVYYGARGRGGHSDYDSVPYKTVGFDVHKYDPHTRSLVYMDRGDLGGLALFVGPVDGGFALSPDDFPELKPNSIYYTDTSAGSEISRQPYGGYDVGIFDYDNATFSSCYYPCGLKSMFTKIQPTPRWFTPSIPPAN